MRRNRASEPCSERLMSVRNQPDTICAVLVDIYNLTNDSKIKFKCRLATAMAKSMSNKLKKRKQELI